MFTFTGLYVTRAKNQNLFGGMLSINAFYQWIRLSPGKNQNLLSLSYYYVYYFWNNVISFVTCFLLLDQTVTRKESKSGKFELLLCLLFLCLLFLG